jgi:hypothetical protein
MKKRLTGILLCILIIALQFFTSVNTVFAEEGLAVSTKITGMTADINGMAYVLPKGTFNISYNITNNSGYDIKDIEILEEGPGGASPKPVKISGSLKPGEPLPYTGNSFKADPDTTPNTVAYSIQYTNQQGEQIQQKGYTSVHVIEVDFDVEYTSNVQGTVFKGEQAVLQAEVESLSNITLYNLTVVDTDLNVEIGTIKVLESGKKATVKATVPIDKPTRGNLAIFYDYTMGLAQSLQKNIKTNLEILVSDEEPVSSLEVSGKTDKTRIPGSTDVVFELILKNTGNTVLRELKCLDWNGKEFHTGDALQPGGEIKVTYTAEVMPDTDYVLQVQARVDNSNQLIKTTWSARLEKLTPQVEIQRTISADGIQAGQPFVLNYIVRNTGNVDLIDVIIEESAFGEIIRLDSIPSGQDVEFSKELVLEQDTYSKTTLTARDAETQKEYSYESSEMEFKIGGPAEDLPRQALSILLRTEQESLNRPGKVEMECIVKNTGQEPLYNLVLTLMDRDMVIDNISILEPGEDKTILIPAFRLEKTETFVVEANGIGADGEKFTAKSQPLTIEIAESGLSGKFNILRVVLIIIILLCVLVIGVLVYTLRGSGSFRFPFRRKKKRPTQGS